MIKFLELELFSYCNRKCSWCPNKFIDRTQNINMSDDILDKVLADLKAINYDGYISLSRYNEPMSRFKTLLRGIKKIKKSLPDCKIVFNTNGDFNSEEYFELISPYVEELSIMDYDNKITEANVSYFGDMKIVVFPSWPLNNKIFDRGGSLSIPTEIRDRPCFYPSKFIAIDYNGNAMPCCDVRSDNPEHEKYIIGNVQDNSIIELFEKQQNRFEYGYESPCKHCQRELGRYICD